MCWYQHIGKIKNNVNVILSFGMHLHCDAPTTNKN
jgi:hypothetical protein